MQTFSPEYIQAESQAAAEVLAVLAHYGFTSAGAYVTAKHSDNNAAIRELLAKAYAAVREVESSTRKNLPRVGQLVTNLYARSSKAALAEMVERVIAALADFVQEEPAPALDKVESLLKAEGVDFMDEAKAVASLAQTVLPTKLTAIYREELAKRRAKAAASALAEHLPAIEARIALLEGYIANGSSLHKGELVLSHESAPIAYRARVQGGTLISHPVDVLSAPQCGSEGMALKVANQRGHGVAPKPRIDVVKLQLEGNKETQARIKECLEC
ncbi:hypothetical protein [Aeromonas aquatica]|uniref:hypothetical protein n=1 Tax=Aeromonas aquatica TaxID=558964 RepID=UPI00051B7C41|nr:hypothetical protein [Aeromonas aquatica]